MKWIKKGLIFAPDKNIWWQQYYGILPTPIYFPKTNNIRVFFASTCKDKFGRIAYIDIDSTNPQKITSNLEKITLDIGNIGAFDDCGVNPSTILKHKNYFYLFYAGYQRHIQTPYSIFSGLAKSKNGIDFSRQQFNPILDRTSTELSIRSAPTVIYENNLFKMWYVADFGWIEINTHIFKNKKIPQYCLKYGESEDGINWITNEKPVIFPTGDEFGFGRPFLYKKKNRYYLFYSIRKKNTPYRLGYAESTDGINWIRKDEEIGIDVSESGWDSEMICYPAVIDVEDKTYLFYNGNNNGETGFGYAELIKE